MPGERTLYRRIQVVLEYAKEGRHPSTATFVDYIAKRQPTNFIYYWRDKQTDRIRHDYSRKSILVAIEIATNLGLLWKKPDYGTADQVGLTKAGTSACDPLRFPAILGRQVLKYLSACGITLELVTRIIDRLLRSDPPNPPTSEAIWRALREQAVSLTIDDETFRRLLNLLGECKVVVAFQKRIFLPRHAGE
jgi:hypothetical protein